MADFSQIISDEYERFCAIIGDDDPYGGQDYVGIHDVLKAHFLIADFFYKEGNGLGGVGPRDPDLLHSAVYRQHMSFDGKYRWETFFEIVATLFFGLIKDHPFYDANKRTALLVLLYHLSLKSFVPTVSQETLENFAVEIAEGKYTSRRRHKKLKRKGVDAGIKFIAKWLRQNTRKVTSGEYIITYRELDSILKQYGFELGHASGSFIDVNQVKSRKTFFGRRPFENRQRVGRIGFPGMTRQVAKSDLKKVRKLTGLTQENGYDSEVFYKGLDDLGALIAGYQDVLRRLADR
jgi:death-on-curing family protein